MEIIDTDELVDMPVDVFSLLDDDDIEFVSAMSRTLENVFGEL